MKAITLAFFALTSTSLFASNVVTSPVRLNNTESKIVVSDSAVPSSRVQLSMATSRRLPINELRSSSLSRLSDRVIAGFRAGAEDGETPLSSDAAICLQQSLPQASEGSPCLGNLFLGLVNLAAKHCHISAPDVQQARSKCGI